VRRDIGIGASARTGDGELMTTALEATEAATERRPPRILVVDDERSMRELLAIVLRREGYEVLLAENGRTAIDLLGREPVDLLISDIKMPDLSGVDVLRAAKKIDQDILGIMITAFASTETAVEAMRLGACDYLSKPFDIDLLKMKVREKIENRQLKQENVLLKRTLGLSHQFSNIIGRSEAMLEVFKMIETIARTNSTILLTGESGTGKGLVAQAIHFHSLRREKPMVSLNCGALPENLLESELFGHMRGSFTGADSNKKGLLEVAERGTVFLDEIGEMSAVMQVKLLRVLQERRFRRVGGLEELQADIRVIAATNQDLAKAIAEGRFREDLYYRINVIPISLPPLRERREDIPLLGEHFMAKYNEQMEKPITGISHEAMELLVHYDWPGNIRELENVMERAVALEATPVVLPDSLPANIRGESASRPHAAAVATVSGLPEAGFDLEAHVQEIERGYIAEALKRAGGVQVKAAELLGMSFRSFRYYVKKYNLR
jgi:two-component system, NtrC family, response regulator PilR